MSDLPDYLLSATRREQNPLRKRINNTKQLREMGEGAVVDTGQPLRVVPTNPNAAITNKAQQNPNLEIKPLKQE